MVGRGLRIRIVGAIVVALLLVPAGPASAGGGPPSNDDFGEARPVTLADLPYTDALDGSEGSVEVGEPDDGCGGTGISTIWYQITPAATMYLQANTFGSNAPAQATLAIFRGTELTALTEIACNFDANSTQNDARVTFKAKAGVRHYIRVGRANGTVVFHLKQVTPPANDDFANATLVDSLPFDDLTNTANATIQKAEPNPDDFHQFADPGPTLWYRVRLPVTAVVRVDMFETEMDAWLMMHRGSSLGSLTPVLGIDTTTGHAPGASLAFKAQAGQTYHVQLGGYGENGPVRVRMLKGTPPANDQFGNAATLLSDGQAVEAGSTRFATLQGAEPQQFNGACNAEFVAGSVWYTFTAPATDEYLLDVSLSFYSTAIRIWTGDSLASLEGVDCGRLSALFNANQGTVYRIQIAGVFGDSGRLIVTLDESVP